MIAKNRKQPEYILMSNELNSDALIKNMMQRLKGWCTTHIDMKRCHNIILSEEGRLCDRLFKKTLITLKTVDVYV